MDPLATDFTPVSSILKGEFEGKAVHLRGWVHRARSSGGLAFVILRDASGIIQ